MEALKKQDKEKGPQTDDELHAWIKRYLGMNIPRVAVCDDHIPPFKFIADVYFERVNSVVLMANRSGSKTASSAIIHLLNSIFKPGCESVTVGAIEAQSRRCYIEVSKMLRMHGGVDQAEEHPLVINQIQRETNFKNGSKLEILPSTIAAVNGPHPQKVHADEVELMDPSVFQESRSMAQSKTIIEVDSNGVEKEKVIKSQNWITSTRKRAAGPMQKILDEIAEAEKHGNKPPYELMTWCIYETTKKQNNCRVAYPDLPENEKCQCDKIVKGKWEDGSPRKFSDVCKGRLARSDGFLELDNVYARFQESDQDTWEAQQECAKPELGGAVFKTWSRERYGIKWWNPDPKYGLIFQAVDFGGSNPHAVGWYQVLNRDIYWWGANQTITDAPEKFLKAGTRVRFDEIYIAEIGNAELAEKVKKREEEWKNTYPGFRVNKRFADVAAKAARLDWHSAGLTTQFYCTRDIKEQIKTCNVILKEDLFAIDLTKSIIFPLEADSYHYPEKKLGMEYDPEIPVDDYNHTMSEFRYTMENLKYMERRGTIIGNLPRTGQERHMTYQKSAAKSSTPRYMPRRPEYGV